LVGVKTGNKGRLFYEQFFLGNFKGWGYAYWSGDQQGEGFAYI